MTHACRRCLATPDTVLSELWSAATVWQTIQTDNYLQGVVGVALGLIFLGIVAVILQLVMRSNVAKAQCCIPM